MDTQGLSRAIAGLLDEGISFEKMQTEFRQIEEQLLATEMCREKLSIINMLVRVVPQWADRQILQLTLEHLDPSEFGVAGTIENPIRVGGILGVARSKADFLLLVAMLQIEGELVERLLDELLSIPTKLQGFDLDMLEAHLLRIMIGAGRPIRWVRKMDPTVLLEAIKLTEEGVDPLIAAEASGVEFTECDSTKEGAWRGIAKLTAVLGS